MTKLTVYSLGILSVIPLLLNVLVVLYIGSIFIYGVGNPASSRSAFVMFTSLFLGAGFAQMGLAVIFAYRFIYKSSLTNHQKIFWVILLLVAGVITLPLFWFKHVKTATSDSTQPV